MWWCQCDPRVWSCGHTQPREVEVGMIFLKVSSYRRRLKAKFIPLPQKPPSMYLSFGSNKKLKLNFQSRRHLWHVFNCATFPKTSNNHEHDALNFDESIWWSILQSLSWSLQDVFVYLCILNFSAVLGICCCVLASHCSGFSCCGAQVLWPWAQKLCLMGSVVLLHVGSSRIRDRTCQSGIESVQSPALAGRFFLHWQADSFCTGRQILNHWTTREGYKKFLFTCGNASAIAN